MSQHDTLTLETTRAAFERYFLESRKSKGANRKPTFERFEDGTYKDDHTQRHWWTWQNAIATPAQAQQAGEVVTDARIIREVLKAGGTQYGEEDRYIDIESSELVAAVRAILATTPPAPAQPAAPPTKVANPYSGVGQVSEGWCRANPGLAAMAINRLSAWLNELQQDQAAGPPPTPPAQQKGGEA